jgi:glycosyltransferase involved in cell wall biosynthesis
VVQGAALTDPSSPELTVVVMAFDEAGNLEAVVHELRASLSRLGTPAEILIVDDGSTDGTPGIADALGAAHQDVRVVHHGVNRGLGGVYRTGFAEARGRLLTFFPADGQFPAAILEDFVPRMAVPDVDILLGYVPRTDSWAGRTLSGVERLVWRVLLGPLPRFQGVFLVRCDRLRALELRSEGRGWGIVLEMLVRARNAGWRMESRPTPIRPRTVGTSKVQNLRTVWSNLRQVVALRVHL